MSGGGRFARARITASDPINGFSFLREAYQATDPAFDGRVTVPVLWDKETRRIVNNSEDDICRMFNGAFRDSATHRCDLFPERYRRRNRPSFEIHLRKREQWRLQRRFATRSALTNTPAARLFAALDELETRLTKSRYLFGDASWSPTGGSSAPSSVSTSSTTSISNAASAVSSTTLTSRVT